MAYDKIITIHTHLSRCVDYTLNHAKTSLYAALTYIENPAKNAVEGRDGLFHLESALNCGLDTAYEDMKSTKARWGKDGPGHVLGYHLIHAYAPGVYVTQFRQFFSVSTNLNQLAHIPTLSAMTHC